jgi:immune inhibitor A
MNGRKSILTVIIIGFFLLLCCCLCIIMVISGSIALGGFAVDSGGNFSFDGLVTTTPVVIRPTELPSESTSSELDDRLDQFRKPDLESRLDQPEQPEISPLPSDEHIQPSSPNDFYVSTDTLETLENTIVPINDLLDLSARLQGKKNIPATVEGPLVPYRVGDKESFWVSNVDTNENFQIQAVLGYETEHAYFWFEQGVSYDKDELHKLADTFEREIYPTNRAFFGSEWSPGVDNDPHIYILFASNLGSGLAGYFSSSDEYHPMAHEYSNAHETFMLNADNLDLDDSFTYGVLAHEFQHMIHWYQDRNESTWLNEGFSELAMFINGYTTGGSDYLFSGNPDLQLNDWPNDPSATSPHYGAAFLYVTYFLDRFGEKATQALVEHPANGMFSVDSVLEDMNIIDPQTGDLIDADDVFIDWAISNYLIDETIEDGRFTYRNYQDVPQVGDTETVHSCDNGRITRDVHQYGADYIRIACPGTYTLYFEGSVQASVLPADVFSGHYAFWSNKGDESDMTLTRSFDFTNHQGSLTLSYWTWFDIEEDWDYLYLEASTDGENWDILTTPSGTDHNPFGNSYGWGYSGLSGGDGSWIKESIDISQFAGQEVLLRFEYVTDAAVNGEGLLLDDISIPEIGFFDDFEDESLDWDTAGFVRIQNVLPQKYEIALISIGRETSVEYISLAADNSAEIPLSIGDDVEEVVLVVAGTTRYTRQPTAYRFEFISE